MQGSSEYRFFATALRAWSVRAEREIALEVEMKGARCQLAEGGRWPTDTEESLALVATDEALAPLVRLLADLDGEALLLVDGQSRGGFNAFHRYQDLHLPAGEHALRLEVAPTGLMGVRLEDPRVRKVAWQVIDARAEAAAFDLMALDEWAADPATPREAAEAARSGLESAIAPLRALPPDRRAFAAWLGRPDLSAEEEALAQAVLRGRGAAPQLRELADSQLAFAIAETARRLRSVYEELARRFPRGVGHVLAIGHAHIDLAWLWPLATARQKARRTFASQTALLSALPDWRFGASTPELWQWLREDDPDLFNRALQLVRDDRIEPLGGLWVECDAQIPQAETVLRQLLYGMRYFHDVSGRWPKSAFLPDTFGFAAGLPTLLAAAGIELFLTTKLNWNDTTAFPYVDFRWYGPDGASVQGHLFGQAQDGYNAPATLTDIRRALARYEQRGGSRTLLYAFGHGDGGGGPTREQVERLARYRELPLMPDIRFTSVDGLSDPEAQLPAIRGPLYLEYHRATLTSQSYAKLRGRRIEEGLVAAEALEVWATGGRCTPRAELWRSLMLSQFHDILPGSSIGPVYEDLAREQQQTLQAVREVELGALERLVPPADQPTLVVANLAGIAVGRQIVRVSEPFAPEDAVLQATEDGGYITASPALPAFGVASVPLRPAVAALPAAPRSVDRVGLSCGALRLEVTPHGVGSMRLGEVELLAGPAGVEAFRQHPEQFDAWELVEPRRRAPIELTHERPVVTEDGPLRTVVRLCHHTPDGSEIHERVILNRVTGLVEVELSAVLRERRTVLRYALPTALRAHAAIGEAMFGWDSHPTRPDGPAQAARFEWPAHRFIDLGEAHLGIALLNDSRYGHGVLGATLWTTLWTTPLFPDPRADEQPAPVRLALLPHRGSWQDAGILAAAHAFSAGVLAQVRGAASLSPQGPISGLTENLRVLALKAAEDGDGVVLHLAEVWGDRGGAELRFAFPVSGAECIDPVREEPLPAHAQLAVVQDGRLTLPYMPFGLCALRLRP